MSNLKSVSYLIRLEVNIKLKQVKQLSSLDIMMRMVMDFLIIMLIWEVSILMDFSKTDIMIMGTSTHLMMIAKMAAMTWMKRRRRTCLAQLHLTQWSTILEQKLDNHYILPLKQLGHHISLNFQMRLNWTA